jgi:xylan 1,4-beta-xylosidase
MGAPSQLTRGQVESLRVRSTGQPETEKEVTVDASGLFETSITLRTNDVWLIKLKPE